MLENVHICIVLGNTDYEVEEVLGVGAYGTVYLACDVNSWNYDEARYAIKVQRPASAREGLIYARLMDRLQDLAVSRDVRAVST